MQLKHHFLLAMPGLAGDYFADCLIYMCEHNEDGAMGVIVNRPSEMTLLELIAKLGLNGPSRFSEDFVWEGGPVAGDQGVILHSDEIRLDSSVNIGPGICIATAMDVLEAIANETGPRHFLTALGYAGWAPGQVEEEIGANVWLTLPAQARIVFDTNWQEKYQTAAQTLGIDMRLMATRPGHA